MGNNIKNFKPCEYEYMLAELPTLFQETALLDRIHGFVKGCVNGRAVLWYEGIQRVEQFMFHKDAFREILLNAIVHKDYSSCNPIQISVYEDKIYI